MDGRRGIPQVNNFQISTSWVPTTPAKPDLPPICENRQQNQQNWLELQRVSHGQGPSQEHQLGLRSFMQEEPEAQQVAALFGLTNSTPATPDSVPNSGNIQNQRNWLGLQRMSHGQGPSQGNKLGLRSFVQEEPEAQYVAARCGLTYSAPVKPGSLSKCGNMQQNQRNWLELQRMSHVQGPSQGNQLSLRSFMQGELEARQVAACCKSTYSAPAKPGPPSICGNRQQNQQNWLDLQRTAHGQGPSQVNQLGLTSFLQEEPEAQHVAAHCGSTNSLTVMEHFDTWEAAVGTNSKTSGDSNKMHNNFSTDDADKWNASFGDLLALAHAAGSTAAAENENTETAFTNSSFNPLVTSQDADGSTICSRLSFNLNSPARMADEGLSSNDALQFEPITPDHIKNKGHVRQKESSEETLKGTEANSNPQPKEQSGQVLNISELQEDHKLDKQKQRRKKHRPKVVVEGQPKRTPKPRTPKQHNSEESKRVKRTYVRRRQVDKPTPNLAEEGTSIVDEPAPNLAEEGVIDPLKVSRPRRACRRSLNFDLESLLCDENLTYWPFLTVEDSYANQSHSSVQLGKGSGATTVNTKLCTAYDMTHPEIQYPDTSTPKIGLNHDKVTMSSQNEISRKCKIIFSDETHDKQAGVLEMTPKCSNNSNCSSACLTQETAERALKRRHSLTTDEAEVYRNIRGSYYNSIQAYQAILPAREPYTSGTLGMHFPAIYKKKRTEKGHPSATQFAKPFTCETNYLSLFHCNGGLSQAKSRIQNANPESAFTAVERYRRKRSKSTSRVRDVASLLEICKHFPTPPAKEVIVSEFGDRCENLYHPNTCMEALVASSRAMMKTKKRSKRSILTTSHMHARQQFTTNARGSLPAIAWRGMSPVDEIAERLQNLDLNRGSVQDQDQYAEIRLRNKVKTENALVIYQRDGSIVPFAGSFVRKRRPRPKVELDDETTRVWKLLLQNINSEGIDGTDEDKTRWWEEERGVFHGRVDSFVARMRLVQGDRRFSPWKGSVVDSVVGVFLTQNVSDHLSSSAFMSLAARFPLKSKTGNKRHEERTRIIIEEPEESALDPDDTIGWRDDQATLGQDLLRISSEESNVEKRDVHSSESSENSTEISVSQQLGSSRESSCVCHESIPVTVNGATSFSGNQVEPEDLLSSQNSMDFPVVQTSERTESFSGSTSFLRLLKIAGSSELHEILDRKSVNIDVACCLDFQNNEETSHKGSVGNLCPCSYSGSSLTEAQGSKCIDDEAAKFSDLSREPGAPEQSNLSPESANQVPTEAPKFSETALDVREEVSVVSDSCKSEHTALRSMNNGKDQGGNTLDRANDSPKSRKQWPGKEKQNVNWDNLRLEAQGNGKKREKTANTMDSLDWDAVRCADVNEIAHTIRERGMNNMLAERIKDFLNRIFREHGSIDLEWLRDVPPDKAKEYLLSIRGLGLKSVECVRLLTLHHLAFPVDTNVGRIAVRLGWVPLQPLPESLQLHLLELYPVLESIQKYLWPRLCKLDQRTLYELHYHMITFGKVFCTKSKPNCNACPMRAECRHFASAFASARLALPAPEEKSIVSATENKAAGQNQFPYFSQLPLPLPQTNKTPVEHPKLINSAPIIEVPATSEPIVEEPATPEPEQKSLEIDIEDAYSEETNEIPIIDLNMEEFTENVKKFVGKNMELQQVEMSKALVALTPEAASIPTPKLKHISRLRTEHQVYELPDSHPLLEGFDKREQDDPCSYLLAIWTPGETADSIQPPGRQCNSQETGTLCDDETCSACNSIRETRSQTVRGTLLIPCRTAMRGSFPLNGTYFQVNEVFADHDSSLNPIDVPRGWLWNLPRRTVYFGTSVPTIFKGQTTESIQHCFWRGFVCVRGFDKRTRAPRPLIARLHFPASKLTRAKGKPDEN